MRATPRLRRRGVGTGVDSTRVLAAHGEGERPDERGPRGSESERGGRTGLGEVSGPAGRGRQNGPAGRNGPREKKKGKELGRVLGCGRRKKERERGLADWAREGEPGRRWDFWAAGKKKKTRAGPIWAENEFSYFSFLQTVQTNSS